MFRRSLVSITAAFALVALMLPDRPAVAVERHCIAQPANTGQPAMTCFATTAEASDTIAAITAGPLTTVIIGVDYTGTSFGGSSLTWFEPSGCGAYSAASMPVGWNDVVSSVTNSSGCGTTLFQNTNFGGSSSSVGVNASSPSLGSFNGQASSQKWCTSSSC